VTSSFTLLDTSYLDLLLLHWPGGEWEKVVEAWSGLENLLDQGKVRAIGRGLYSTINVSTQTDRLVEATISNEIHPHYNGRHNQLQNRRLRLSTFWHNKLYKNRALWS